MFPSLLRCNFQHAPVRSSFEIFLFFLNLRRTLFFLFRDFREFPFLSGVFSFFFSWFSGFFSSFFYNFQKIFSFLQLWDSLFPFLHQLLRSLFLFLRISGSLSFFFATFETLFIATFGTLLLFFHDFRGSLLFATFDIIFFYFMFFWELSLFRDFRDCLFPQGANCRPSPSPPRRPSV